MTKTFRKYAFALSPPWLQRRFGERFIGLVAGLTGDLMAEGLTQAVRAGWLRSSSSPPDALPSFGDERLMPRYPADTDVTYRARLAEAWDTWQRAGNETAIIGQFFAFGLTNVVIVPAANTSTRPRAEWEFTHPSTITDTFTATFVADPGGGNSTLSGLADFLANGYNGDDRLLVQGSVANDGYFDVLNVTPTLITMNGIVFVNEGPTANVTLDQTNWSLFAVIVEQPHPWVSWSVGDGHIVGVGGITVGSTATTTDIDGVKGIIRKWKSAHEINPIIYVVLTGTYVGGFVVGDGTVLDASAEVIQWAHQ